MTGAPAPVVHQSGRPYALTAPKAGGKASALLDDSGNASPVQVTPLSKRHRRITCHNNVVDNPYRH